MRRRSELGGGQRRLRRALGIAERDQRAQLAIGGAVARRQGEQHERPPAGGELGPERAERRVAGRRVERERGGDAQLGRPRGVRRQRLQRRLVTIARQRGGALGSGARSAASAAR